MTNRAFHDLPLSFRTLSSTQQCFGLAAFGMAGCVLSYFWWITHTGAAAPVFIVAGLALYVWYVCKLVHAGTRQWYTAIGTYRLFGAGVSRPALRLLGDAMRVSAQAGASGVVIACAGALLLPDVFLAPAAVAGAAGFSLAAGLGAGAHAIRQACRIPMPHLLGADAPATELVTRFYPGHPVAARPASWHWERLPALQLLCLFVLTFMERNLAASKAPEAATVDKMTAWLPALNELVAALSPYPAAQGAGDHPASAADRIMEGVLERVGEFLASLDTRGQGHSSVDAAAPLVSLPRLLADMIVGADPGDGHAGADKAADDGGTPLPQAGALQSPPVDEAPAQAAAGSTAPLPTHWIVSEDGSVTYSFMVGDKGQVVIFEPYPVAMSTEEFLFLYPEMNELLGNVAPGMYGGVAGLNAWAILGPFEEGSVIETAYADTGAAEEAALAAHITGVLEQPDLLGGKAIL